MSADAWKAVGELIGLLVIIAQGYFAMKQRGVQDVKIDKIQETAKATHDAVDGHLTSVTNELAATSRKVAILTGSPKDDARATANENIASEHAAEKKAAE